MVSPLAPITRTRMIRLLAALISGLLFLSSLSLFFTSTPPLSAASSTIWYVDHDRKDGLVAWWTFDEGSTDWIIDASLNTNIGTVNGSLMYTHTVPTAIKFRNPFGAVFDGSTHVTIEDNPSLDIDQALSIVFWVKVDNPKQDQKIVGKVSPSMDSGYLLGINSNQIDVEIWGSDNNYQRVTTGFIPAAKWIHLGMTWQNGEQMVTYIDGQVVDTRLATSTIITNNQALQIGEALEGAEVFRFKGALDDLRVYDRALSQDEMLALASGDILCGRSWETACPILQQALVAAQSGDQIWVAEGIYTPTMLIAATDQRSATFDLPSGVAVYGGFAGSESRLEERNWQRNLTVLSGDLAGNDKTTPSGVVTDTANITGTNTYHVIRSSGLAELTRLDGLTVTAGQTAINLDYTNCNEDECGGGLINSNSNLILANITFIGNMADWYGGGVYNKNSILTLTDVSFVGNSTARDGGGMYNDDSQLMLTGVTFAGNSVTKFGGGMYNLHSDLALNDVIFSDNSVGVSGGGMWNYDSGLALNDVIFSNNAARQSGGGMYNSYSSLTSTVITFTSNIAGFNGGGVYNDRSNLMLISAVFTDNSTDGDGGGALLVGGSSILSKVIFIGNSAFEDGGGLVDAGSDSKLTTVTFFGNSAFNGGGMANSNSDSKQTDVVFTDNSAYYGGGMYNFDSSPILTDVLFTDNSAGNGGGIYNSLSQPRLTAITITNNSAYNGGGIANLYSSNPTLTAVTISGNEAYYGGGIFNRDTSNATLTDVTIAGNSAGLGGGLYNRSNSDPMLTDVIVTGNAADLGGGMFNEASSPKLVNVTMTGNSAGLGGGGMVNINDSNPTLVNTIVWHNWSNGGTGMITASIRNDDSNPTIHHSLIQGSGGSGVNWNSAVGSDGGHNLDCDPLFMSPIIPTNRSVTTTGNLRLQADSPAIDVGDNIANPTTTDLAGQPRRVDGDRDGQTVIDLGAFEFQVEFIERYLPFIIH